MFSLQTIFGKGDKFYGLLEASAAAARESARALGELLATPPAQRSLEKFKLARQKEKDLAAEISRELVNTFVTALELPAQAHAAMVAAVAPYVDTAISKTVNVPADYRYEDFKDLYLQAWRARLKGLATYRPNAILGSVLDTGPTPETTASVATVDPMRTVIESRPPGALPAVRPATVPDEVAVIGVDNDGDQPKERERLVYLLEGSDSGWRNQHQYQPYPCVCCTGYLQCNAYRHRQQWLYRYCSSGRTGECCTCGRFHPIGYYHLLGRYHFV